MPNELSEVVGVRVRATRTRRGWAVADLAARCADAGMPALTTAALYALESGRRDSTGRRRRMVTVDECAVLSRVLDVDLVPPWRGDRVCDCAARVRALADELDSPR